MQLPRLFNYQSSAEQRFQSAADRRSGRFPSTLAVLRTLCGALLLVPALVGGPTIAQETNPQSFKLIELYTSHGCSSCPPADRLLGELLEQDEELLALEFHVDYWNALVHGKDGSFTDPFSKASYSSRQRQYNAASLAGRPGVYTPQAVINGRFAAVGSNLMHVNKALSRVNEAALNIQIEQDSDAAKLLVTVSGDAAQLDVLRGTDIQLARYLDRTVTNVTGGENRNKTLVNHHVVTELDTLGEVAASGQMRFTIARPADTEGCVILIQEAALTPIYAASACP